MTKYKALYKFTGKTEDDRRDIVTTLVNMTACEVERKHRYSTVNAILEVLYTAKVSRRKQVWYKTIEALIEDIESNTPEHALIIARYVSNRILPGLV